MICPHCKRSGRFYQELGVEGMFCLVCKHIVIMPVTPELKDHELRSLKNQVLVQIAGFNDMVRFDLFSGANFVFDDIKKNLEKLVAHDVYIEELYEKEHKE